MGVGEDIDGTVVKLEIHHGQMDRGSNGTANNTGEQQGDQVLSETTSNAAQNVEIERFQYSLFRL